MLLLLISFIAGALTALAPCILSLLPVIIGGSLSGERSNKRALIVTASLGVSVVVFTILLKASTVFVNIPPEAWKIISGSIIVVLGTAMVFPKLWDSLPLLSRINRDSNRLLATGYQKQNFLGDILVGAALGPVFASCSPTYFLILATVLPVSFALGLIYLFTYALGLTLMLLLITIGGQKLLDTLGVASDSYGWFKRSIGALFIVVGLGITFGIDQKIQVAVSGGIFDTSRIEQYLLEKNGGTQLMPEGADTLNETAGVPVGVTSAERNAIKLMRYPKAPEIVRPSGFVNTHDAPIRIADYIGKNVVLIDFWTYSCINCIRTQPYLNAWYEKYNDQGLEIIGIHTPEFAFEHKIESVRKAVSDEGIKYPIVLDNQYATWSAFKNQYWPRKYLIDIDGYIVYDLAGEGKYDETEKEIQRALAERARVLGLDGGVAGGYVVPQKVTEVDFRRVGSPETYFGSARNEYLGNGVRHQSGTQTFTLPDTIKRNTLYLTGAWAIDEERARSLSAGSIVYTYSSKNVYLVMSADTPTTLTVLLDGTEVRTIEVQEHTLYTIIEGADYGEHSLELRIPREGVEVFAFTFG